MFFFLISYFNVRFIKFFFHLLNEVILPSWSGLRVWWVNSSFFFLIDFFPLIRLYDLSYLSFREIILVSWLGLWFWWFNPCCLELFFLSIFFQLHLSTLGWLRIRFCNSFQFALYWVILISWYRSQVWHVNPGWLKLFF